MTNPSHRLSRVTGTLITFALSCLLAGCATAPATPLPQANDEWYVAGETALAATLARPIPRLSARNVILFIGDGMDVATTTAARILAGQQRGESGEENFLSFERFPYTGLAKTYNTNQQTPDSAGTATAMLSGVKTKAGVVGLTDQAGRGSCVDIAQNRAKSILSLAEESGLSTGVISTARITHATPAVAYAHSPDRDWEGDHEIPAGESACKDIARQLVDYEHGDGIDVIFGGGRRYFMPADVPDPEEPGEFGERKDGRNLIALWQQSAPGAREYVWNREQFDALDESPPDQVLGLFEHSHMRYEVDRSSDPAGEPALAEMTATAINMLARNPGGYFLLIEGGRIDHGHHDGNAYRALTDTIAFADAVEVAAAMTSSSDTLIVVTADHGHTMRIVGYPTRGNPILGLVVENRPDGVARTQPEPDLNGRPYTTIGYINGPGYQGASNEQPAGPKHQRHEPTSALPLEDGRADLSAVDTTHPDYLQEAGIVTFSVDSDGEKYGSETHSGGDVAIFARGPGAQLLSGVHEQNFIFHVMRYVQGL